jgi:hypothetical protein
MRIAIRNLATLLLMLGMAAPAMAAAPHTKPANYGQCVSAGLIDPSEKLAGPFTDNRNNTNIPPGRADDATIACFVD